MFADPTRSGALKVNFPGREIDKLPETCSLRLADTAPDDGWSHVEIGNYMNMTEERVRQIEAEAMRKVLEAAPELADLFGPKS
jgi:hypothetical protein